MIIGIYLRYFKTYSGINYIPISFGERFNGLVGNNGVGKSSVLEGLDFLFNEKDFKYNSSVSKSGKSTTNPYLVPIFLIDKNSKVISNKNSKVAESYSNFVWGFEDNTNFTVNKDLTNILSVQKKIFERDDLKDEYYLLPIGLNYDRKIELSIFNKGELAKKIIDDYDGDSNKQINSNIVDEKFMPLLEDILSHYEYIYIPNDIDPAQFTNLENNHVQALMGKSLVELIESCVPKDDIHKISSKLDGFLTELQVVMKDYAFRMPAKRQTKLKKASVYNLIIEDFFKSRKLHKIDKKDTWLEVNTLSSGEKQKAIIDLTESFLKKYRNSAKNIILAVDEPESSLHMSACYNQFDALYKISKSTSQFLFSTHWYGFIPTISNGNVCVITKLKENKHSFDLISSSAYREEIRQNIIKTQGQLPIDVRLKSINDLIQSIVTSILSEDPFNWIICEGSSEKVYFETFFKNEILSKKLRIIPVGGAASVKKIYENLIVTYEDFKNEVNGKVILLIDTDTQVLEFETNNSKHKNIKCFRILNEPHKKGITLVDVNSNKKSPKTEIEDALDGEIMIKTLWNLKDQFSPHLDDFLEFMSGEKLANDANSSFFSLDLKPSRQEQLDQIFKLKGFKFKFAEIYCKNTEFEDEIPEWIREIKAML